MTGLIQTPDLQRAPLSASITAGDDPKALGFPHGFPFHLWEPQSARYLHYWDWFSGAILNETVQTAKGPVDRYPLRINPIRTIARKHAAVLLGEEIFDSPRPLISTIAKARQQLVPMTDGGEKVKPADRAQAELAQAIVNEVWSDSNGRALQAENAEISQFLGGSVFRVEWDPSKLTTHRIPITIRTYLPDFFLPIWAEGKPYDLIEAFLVFRIPAAAAVADFGVDIPDKTIMPVYVEHWTRTHYSVYINGEPVSRDLGGVKQVMKDLPNPFGFVPFVYIPHERVGGFYGNSHVPDMEGIVKEYNSRLSNLGDAIRQTVMRRRYGRNLGNQVGDKIINKSTTVIDLGNTLPGNKDAPEVYSEEAPALPETMTSYTDTLWLQLIRDSFLSDIAFGEDEGSQRSALTLAFRMWPTTSHIRIERTHWTGGLNRVAEMIIRMIIIKKKLLPQLAGLDDDVLMRIHFTQDWLPMIPRDREQMVSEIILRYQAGLISLPRALEMFSDVPYIDDEITEIKKWLEYQAKLKQKVSEAGSQQPSGEGAPSDTTKPAATDGLKDE